MVSFETHRALATTARMVCAAAIAASYGVHAQPGRLTDQQREIVATIDEAQSAEGSYSLDLVTPLTALGLTYHERGDYERAAETVERALQIVRANYGLYSLDQASLLRLLIAAEQEAGDFESVGKLQERLLMLAKRNPADLRTVPILREAGDRQMEVAQNVRDHGLPLALSVNFSYMPGPGLGGMGGTPTSRDFMARMLTMQAVGNYVGAIRVLVEHELYDSDELRDLELDLVRISYDSGAYSYGRNSLRRVISYDTASSKPWLARVKGVVQIADWDLLYSHNGMALNLYKDVHAELEKKGIAAETVAELFAPEVPVALPTFVPNPVVSPKTEDSTGFIDVSFEITKYGRSQAVKTLDTTTNASKSARRDLEALVKATRFRPQLTDGAFMRTEPVVVRYYVSESNPET